MVTLFNKDYKCVFHMADMEEGLLAPLTEEALGITFLYDSDMFFQKVTVSLVCMNFATASAQAMSSLCLHCLSRYLKCNLVFCITWSQIGSCLGFPTSRHRI